MTYSDDFLVQKLREILLKLYPTPQTSLTIQGNPSNSNSKFPKFFVSLSEGETGPELSIFEKQDNLEQGGDVFPDGEIETVMGPGQLQFRDETLSGSNTTFLSSLKLIENDEEFVGGIVHNVSSIDRVGVENSALILGKVNSSPKRDLYENALNRNLHEFIQVLKMSLSPGGGGGGQGESGIWKEDEANAIGGGGGGGVGELNLNNHIDISREGGGTRLGLDPGNLEFNLTLDDIMDLNMLLDGSENVLQFKHVLIIFLYFLIAVVSIVGNLLVVQLVIRSRRLHTLTHALLANLAVADLLMATLNIPFSAARVILAEWPFGSVLCHMVPFIQVTSVYVTSGTMAVIAIDRYSVIMNPLGRRMKSSHGVLLVLAIWLVSGLLSLPYAIHHKVVRVLTMGVVSRCQAEFSNESRRWLTVGTFLAQYLVPLLFTSISYVSIMQRLRQRSDGLGSTTPRQVAAQSRAKKKTIKMLQITVLFFAASWAPINIYHLLTHFSLVRHNSTAILICHLIAMSSCTVNPFIYCWFNDHFRREALKWMRCFRRRRCPIVHPGVEIGGMLTQADRACVGGTQSTTFVSTSLRSPRLPRGPTHPGDGPLVERNTPAPQYQSPSPTSHNSHGHIFTNGNGVSRGGHISPASFSSPPTHSKNKKKSSLFDHPLSKNSRSDLGFSLGEITVTVRYSKERPESLFLIRRQSYEDIFTASASAVSAPTSTTSRFNPEVLELEQDDPEECMGRGRGVLGGEKRIDKDEEEDELGGFKNSELKFQNEDLKTEIFSGEGQLQQLKQNKVAEKVESDMTPNAEDDPNLQEY